MDGRMALVSSRTTGTMWEHGPICISLLQPRAKRTTATSAVTDSPVAITGSTWGATDSSQGRMFLFVLTEQALLTAGTLDTHMFILNKKHNTSFLHNKPLHIPEQGSF
ncbi:hypothetical protein EYF80_065854 [Liparis tanakae]|uniref:Uncharacterized protein n=1 Tax=Liparis tanakae TaxID=230148 RepID=A0A4Z2E5U9_9TELE|nr:hypothetical protein EYF80_065854 [Liparis tanakae]